MLTTVPLQSPDGTYLVLNHIRGMQKCRVTRLQLILHTAPADGTDPYTGIDCPKRELVLGLQF